MVLVSEQTNETKVTIVIKAIMITGIIRKTAEERIIITVYLNNVDTVQPFLLRSLITCKGGDAGGSGAVRV